MSDSDNEDHLKDARKTFREAIFGFRRAGAHAYYGTKGWISERSLIIQVPIVAITGYLSTKTIELIGKFVLRKAQNVSGDLINFAVQKAGSVSPSIDQIILAFLGVIFGFSWYTAWKVRMVENEIIAYPQGGAPIADGGRILPESNILPTSMGGAIGGAIAGGALGSALSIQAAVTGAMVGATIGHSVERTAIDENLTEFERQLLGLIRAVYPKEPFTRHNLNQILSESDIGREIKTTYVLNRLVQKGYLKKVHEGGSRPFFLDLNATEEEIEVAPFGDQERFDQMIRQVLSRNGYSKEDLDVQDWSNMTEVQRAINRVSGEVQIVIVSDSTQYKLSKSD